MENEMWFPDGVWEHIRSYMGIWKYPYNKVVNEVPKIRDLIHKPTERYNEMFNIIPSEKSENEKPNKEEMQLELQNFLQEIKQSDSINTLSDNIAFSNY